MRRVYLIFSVIVLAGAALTSCNVDAKFSDYIPTHALQAMVKSATATCGEETTKGVVDNATHKIEFVFVKNVDFSNVDVKIEYATRTILKEGAFREKSIDLTKPYMFELNNLEKDFTYTISAEKALVAHVDRTQCGVILGLENDANIVETDAYLVSCLFDGKWMSKKGAYTEVGYKSFGWLVAAPAPEGHGNSFTFDAGEPMRLSQMRIWPYWPYCNNAPAIFEIYAWPLPGEPSGDWTNWVKIGDCDDSEKWEIVKNAEPGSEKDLTMHGSTLEFPYGDVPEARYYRFKMVKNFYEAFGPAMDQYWSGRINWFSISEMELWRYNIEEE